MSAAARDKPVTLGCVLPERLPARLLGDPMRLRQVLVNPLHNAVKFTERGRIDLGVALLDETAHAVKLRLRGARRRRRGIAEWQIDSVFDAFMQGDARRRGATAAAGSGWRSCELADAMGGEVGVQSRVGEGSMFRFEVALARAGADEPVAAEPARDTTTAPAHVLLAEHASAASPPAWTTT